MRRTLTLMLLVFSQFAIAQVITARSSNVIEGKLSTGARYRMEVPNIWNGSVLLYSRGYSSSIQGQIRVSPSSEKEQLISQGYALIASNYSRSGWSLEEAVPDQLAVLDLFIQKFGQPKQVIAWGSSMGGLITVALLERFPDRFDAGIALCSSASGTLGMMNTALDGAWVFSTLVKNEVELPIMLNQSGPSDQEHRATWKRAIDQAQITPLGRARIALAASIAHIHPWAIGFAMPKLDDIDSVQQGMKENLLAGVLLPRDDQEKRASGNFSWNYGVDYEQALLKSSKYEIVKQLYQNAGKSLDDDLKKLAESPRVVASKDAVSYMLKNYVPTGQMHKPFLLMQNVSDPMTLPEFTEDYRRNADAAGYGNLVHTAYIERVGHCNFEQAEIIASLHAIQIRLSLDKWKISAAAMNEMAGTNSFIENVPPELNRSCSSGPKGCVGW
jgi:pimeloyl-ACP methyl ester carboxylesterase